MGKLDWNEVGKYNRKVMWDKQCLNLPELEQEVLIFFSETDRNCRKDPMSGNNIPFDKYGRVITGYFYLEEEELSITDGVSCFGHIPDGIKWAEYNRLSQPNKQVGMCESFVCKKYNVISGKCNQISCKECKEGDCVNCKMFLSKSNSCKNSKVW